MILIVGWSRIYRSHVNKALTESGYDTIVLDNLKLWS